MYVDLDSHTIYNVGLYVVVCVVGIIAAVISAMVRITWKRRMNDGVDCNADDDKCGMLMINMISGDK